jgi:hypothetical protein
VRARPTVLSLGQLFPQRPRRLKAIEEFLEESHSLKLAPTLKNVKELFKALISIPKTFKDIADWLVSRDTKVLQAAPAGELG